MAGYNWFMQDAKSNLFMLLKIEHPTPEQDQMAERLITDVCGYTRSQLHKRPF